MQHETFVCNSDFSGAEVRALIKTATGKMRVHAQDIWFCRENIFLAIVPRTFFSVDV